jgi:threonine/homoserine/homoserine lactone efflux protein
MWELKDNTSISEVRQWAKEKQLADMEYAHKTLRNEVFPKLLLLLYLWWIICILHVIVPRRIQRYIQNINMNNIIFNIMIGILAVDVVSWLLKYFVM